MLQMRNNSCKGCVEPKRHIGCHSTCEEYKQCVREFEELKKKIEEEKRKDRYFKQYKYEKITKELTKGRHR